MSFSTLFLQAHLPLVRHPEHETFLEERWFFEAVSETYLPLLRMMKRLEVDGIPFRLSMSFSPTLAFMLQDPFLISRYRSHLDRSIELAEKELERTFGDAVYHPLAEMYSVLLMEDRRDIDDVLAGNILRGFDYFAKKGFVEMVATAATHAFLPNYRNYPEIIRAQVGLGVEQFQQLFGVPPHGFWLPECGYYEGLEDILAKFGIKYFVGAAHGVLLGSELPKNGVYTPIKTAAGVAVFPRDANTARWVWSADHGYPADPLYRDFYRDVGYDLPLDYVRPYIHDNDTRIDTGFKYFAITGATDEKVPYDPERARRRVGEHARDFLIRQQDHLHKLEKLTDKPPIITSPYDAELFGHWWFEGPVWIEELFRQAHSMRSTGELEFQFTTGAAYLKENAPTQTMQPSFSSWGSRGYSEVWLDGSNDWVNRHTHMAIERMGELIARFPGETGLKKRALDQAAREVLLSQASDWPFIMNARTVIPYAKRRVKEHLFNFTRIYEELSRGNVGTEWLTSLEKKNSIFPDIDYRILRLRSTETLTRIG